MVEVTSTNPFSRPILDGRAADWQTAYLTFPARRALEDMWNKIGGNDEVPGTWGSIVGTLSDQTDLQAELDAKTNISGTPVNNQIAVWTSSTDIEGDANFTWDGATLSITGDLDLGFTQGSVIFQGATNLDEANLFWDDSTDRLGIGIATPQETLAVAGDVVVPKTSGVGVKVDNTTPTFGWRDLLGDIKTRPAAGGGAAAQPDFVAYRGSIYGYRFGTIAPNAHLHEAFIEFHIPHDYVPGTDLYIHSHWSQIVADTGGAAGVPGVAEWFWDFTYADGHGTAGGAADPFVAPLTISTTQQGSTTQYGHMIAEVAFTNDGGDATHLDRNTIAVDGLVLVRVYRDPGSANDTLNQNTFLHFVDIHYQSTNMATKQRAPDFYT